MSKPYKLITTEISLKNKGFAKSFSNIFLGTADSLFYLFIKSYGHTHNPIISTVEKEFIIYDKNPKHILVFKELLSWDGIINVDGVKDAKDFIKFSNFLSSIEKKHNVKILNSGSLSFLNATIGLMHRHAFRENFLEAWTKFKNSKFTFLEIDVIKENDKFLNKLKEIYSYKEHIYVYLSFIFNPQNYYKDEYLESLNNTLHFHWISKDINYAEIIDETNSKFIENHVGKIYAGLNPHFCILPWMHIQYKPNGQSKLCCRYDNIKERNDFISNKDDKFLLTTPSRQNLIIQKTSIEDTFFSKYWGTARQYTLENSNISGCHKCYKEEQVSGDLPISMRIGSSILYNNGFLHKNIRKKVPSIEFLEIGFGNYCNMACLTCNSSLSTTWHDDEIKFNKLVGKNLQREIFPKLDNLKFLPNKETLETLKIIKFTGGEPMINPEFIKFIDHICEEGFPENISLEIYTNCSYIPSPKLLANFKKFKNIQLCLSIDAYGDLNNYIRYGSNWSGEEKQTVKKSYTFWLEQGKNNENINVVLSPTLSILNIFDIKNLLENWVFDYINSGNTIKNKPRSTLIHDEEFVGFIKIQPAFDPAYISMNVLPKEYYKEIEEWCDSYGKKDFFSNYPNFDVLPDSIIVSLQKIRSTISRCKGDLENARNLIEYLNKMDLIRNNSAKENLPVLLNNLKDFLSKN